MTITETPQHQQERDHSLPSDPPTRRRARDDLADTPTEHLEAHLTTLVEQLHFGTYELLVLVGELDARGAWATWGSLTCAAWLAELSDIEVCTARTQVRVARALREFPALDEAMATGEISYAKARTLTPNLTHDNIDALISIARTTPAGLLGTAIANWCMGHEDQDLIDARHHEARSMTWRTRADGMVVFTITVPPDRAGAIEAIIDTDVTRHHPEPHNQHAPADASEPGSEPVNRSYPTLAQQRADAFLRIINTTPDTTSGSGNPGQRSVAEVIVHVTPEGKTLADGTPLTDHAVGRMLPDAFVSLLIEDHQRQPIDASPRRRFPTRRQRRVIDARNPECAHQGCHARDFLQYDHIEPWNPDQPNTVIANLQRLCGPHNRTKGRRPGPAPDVRSDPSGDRTRAKPSQSPDA